MRRVGNNMYVGLCGRNIEQIGTCNPTPRGKDRYECPDKVLSYSELPHKNHPIEISLACFSSVANLYYTPLCNYVNTERDSVNRPDVVKAQRLATVP